MLTANQRWVALLVGCVDIYDLRDSTTLEPSFWVPLFLGGL